MKNAVIHRALSLITKESDMKLIKKVTANKLSLPSQRDAGAKTELVKTVGIGCVPQGHN